MSQKINENTLRHRIERTSIGSDILGKFSSRIQGLHTSAKRQDGVFFLVLVLMSLAVYWKFIFGVKAFLLMDIGDDSY